jgi:hypothetical protein
MSLVLNSPFAGMQPGEQINYDMLELSGQASWENFTL